MDTESYPTGHGLLSRWTMESILLDTECYPYGDGVLFYWTQGSILLGTCTILLDKEKHPPRQKLSQAKQSTGHKVLSGWTLFYPTTPPPSPKIRDEKNLDPG